VGRIVKPHGIRGEVTVDVHTDEPERRFAAGSVLVTDPPRSEPLTVTASRWHSGRLLITFGEVTDRTQAEPLRGTWLMVAADDAPSADPDVFHDQQLAGLSVVTLGGELVGTVTSVRHHGQDLLVVEPAPGSSFRGEVLVPFVAAIVVEVDLASGRLVLDPPPGLLDLATDGTGR
jgi:16S rRNA processing protein RimM